MGFSLDDLYCKEKDSIGCVLSMFTSRPPSASSIKIDFDFDLDDDDNFSNNQDVTKSLTVLSTTLSGLKLELNHFKAIWKKYSEVISSTHIGFLLRLLM